MLAKPYLAMIWDFGEAMGAKALASRCAGSTTALRYILPKREKHTEDDELLDWEGGGLGLADMLELAIWHGRSHVDGWWRTLTAGQRFVKQLTVEGLSTFVKKEVGKSRELER